MGEVTAPLSYWDARKGSPDPLHIQRVPSADLDEDGDPDAKSKIRPDGLKDSEKAPINFDTINICSDEYKITSKTSQIDNTEKCLPGFKPRLTSPRVVLFKRPESQASTRQNLLLFTLDPNFLPTYNVYKVYLNCQKPKYDLIQPETSDKERSYLFEPEQQYLIEIGLSPNIPPGKWSSRADYILLFTKNTNTLESRFSDPVWEGKDVKYPHFGDEFGSYKATMSPEGKATLFTEHKEISIGTYNPDQYCPFFDPESRSIRFFWLDGARNGCPGGLTRMFSIELRPHSDGESGGSDAAAGGGKDDQKNGEMVFPRECYYNLVFKNGKLKDIMDQLSCPCKMKPIQEC